MDFSKLKNRLLIALCVFVVIFPFWCVRGLCAELENVDFDIIDGLRASSNSNFFVAQSGYYVGYFQTEPGYIYHIQKNSGTVSAPIVGTSDLPSANVEYNLLSMISTDDTYDYLSNSNSYLFVAFSTNSNGSTITVTREKLSNMDGAVGDLVDNVGLTNLWGVFNIGINYIVVVVLFAFGFFIIVALIKKLRKGRGGF